MLSCSAMTIDLNCDMGELDDAEREAALIESVTSANIACGGHAGDERTMERTVRLALARGVRIGAHPSYPDHANFGRLEMEMTPEEITATVVAQIRRLEAVAASLGARTAHVKPHGALYNVAAKHDAVARAIGEAVLKWNPQAILFGLAGSRMLAVWSGMGLATAAEAFADRRYEPDGSLRARRFADALISDPQAAAAQAVRFAKEGSAGTICVHGDTPGAIEIARACRAALDSLH